MVDFAALPPEINSGLMYAGAGVGPLLAAATAWAGLADELESAADRCAAVLAELSGIAWQGPASAAMADAASPYAVWMRTTAGQLARAAGQASAAANSYQLAYAATVPPPVIAENRARLAALVATNLFGQNTGAIAATEAGYAQMWAQDAVAMYRYACDSAGAAALTPLTAPPAVTTGDRPAAGSTPTSLVQLIAGLPNAVQQLAAPSMGGANIFSPANGTVDFGLSGLLNMLSGHTNSALGDLLNTNLGDSIFSSGFANPTGVFNVFNAFDYLLVYAAQDFATTHASGGLGALGSMSAQVSGIGSAPASSATLAALNNAHPGTATITAEVGTATRSGSLTVPQRWADICTPARTGGAITTDSGSPTAPMGVGAGSTALPGAPANAAPRGKSRYGRRYGFRPVIVAHPPAGG